MKTKPDIIEIKVENGIPEPTRRFSLKGNLAAIRIALGSLRPNESFMWKDNKSLYDAARQLKIKITTRKVDGKGYRVWRRFGEN